MTLDPTKTTPTKVPPPPEVEPVTLRPATVADAAALALIGAATFLEAFTWMLPGSDIVAHCAKHHTAAAYEGYLAKPNTRVTLATAGSFADDLSAVGYTLLSDPELPTINILSGDIELKRIYLLSRFRAVPVMGHPGIRPAQALLDTAITDALALGRTRLLLGVNDGNQRALNFYYRNGFIEAGTRTFQVGSLTCSDLILAKAL
ncbi:GNAT family N-acetyltransferase [Granulicella paludicola]|uniref:GNAT family N-acetyltransferase n=1 Tax=Granulicella paludicola TaxID=474951 RepID=UPI0021E0AA6C|nr:N-acetyltransferase [Granulicella paludicola]